MLATVQRPLTRQPPVYGKRSPTKTACRADYRHTAFHNDDRKSGRQPCPASSEDGCNSIGVEVDPAYFALGVDRLRRETGTLLSLARVQEHDDAFPQRLRCASG
ncbi:MAG: hypothetical protein AAF471_05740 [Myxococcota bacterium]